MGLIALAAGLSATIGIVLTRIGTPKQWRLARQILNSLRSLIYSEEAASGDRVDQHRVTLFKKVGKTLVPVERSGHGTMISSSAFRVPDDPAKAEGIAGQAFYLETILFKENLPDIDESTPEDVLKHYARSTWTHIDYVKERRPRARSFCAMQVTVNNNPWGVVVIDSTNKKAKQEPKHQAAYALAAELVGTVFE